MSVSPKAADQTLPLCLIPSKDAQAFNLLATNTGNIPCTLNPDKLADTVLRMPKQKTNPSEVIAIGINLRNRIRNTWKAELETALKVISNPEVREELNKIISQHITSFIQYLRPQYLTNTLGDPNFTYVLRVFNPINPAADSLYRASDYPLSRPFSRIQLAGDVLETNLPKLGARPILPGSGVHYFDGGMKAPPAACGIRTSQIGIIGEIIPDAPHPTDRFDLFSFGTWRRLLGS